MTVGAVEEFAYAAAGLGFASVAAAAEEAAFVAVVAVDLMVVVAVHAAAAAVAAGCSNNIATSDCTIGYSAHCHIAH